MTAALTTPCRSANCLCHLVPVMGTSGLYRVVTSLKAGDRVRVHLKHHAYPIVGILQRPTNSLLDPDGESHLLFLDEPGGHIIRDSAGRPGVSVRDVELWDVDAAFDAAMDQAEEYLKVALEHRTAPKSEKEALQVKVDEAKAEFIAAWLRGTA